MAPQLARKFRHHLRHDFKPALNLIERHHLATRRNVDLSAYQHGPRSVRLWVEYVEPKRLAVALQHPRGEPVADTWRLVGIDLLKILRRADGVERSLAAVERRMHRADVVEEVGLERTEHLELHRAHATVPQTWLAHGVWHGANGQALAASRLSQVANRAHGVRAPERAVEIRRPTP